MVEKIIVLLKQLPLDKQHIIYRILCSMVSK